nr:hypothetical protein [Streptomyces capillispiralis]
MGSEQPVCPACGQPVEMVIRRHKTLGAWVPVWVHGPCHNPTCDRFLAGGTGQGQEAEEAEEAEEPGRPETAGESGTAESAPASRDAGPAGTRR